MTDKIKGVGMDTINGMTRAVKSTITTADKAVESKSGKVTIITIIMAVLAYLGISVSDVRQTFKTVPVIAEQLTVKDGEKTLIEEIRLIRENLETINKYMVTHSDLVALQSEFRDKRGRVDEMNIQRAIAVSRVATE